MVSDKVLPSNGSQRIFTIGLNVLSESHLKIYLDGVAISADDYDLINNAAVFHTAPAEGTLTLQVGTTPDDLLLTPTDAGIVAANIDNVATVAGSIASVNTVADNGTNIDTIADDITNVNTTADNIHDIATAADNITDIQNAHNNATLAEGYKDLAQEAYEDAAAIVSYPDLNTAGGGSIYTSTGVILANTTIPSGTNAMSIEELTLADDVELTISDNASLKII